MKFEYRDYNITIDYDEDPINPRKDFDNFNFGTMVCFHTRYELGDKHNLTIEQVKEIAESKDYVVRPVYLLDHGGLRMKTRPFREDPQGWDSGQVGLIFVSMEKVKQEYGEVTSNNIDKAYQVLESEVETYDDYLSGNIYSYTITDKDGNIVDSCCGFFGDPYAKGGMIEVIKEVIDAEWNRRLKHEGVQQILTLDE